MYCKKIRHTYFKVSLRLATYMSLTIYEFENEHIEMTEV